MGFREITPLLKAAPGAAAVKFRIDAAKKDTYFGAVLTLPPPVVAEMTLKNGDQFKLFVGDGPDVGILRLAKATKGPLRLTITAFGKSGSQVARIKLGQFDQLPKMKVKSREVDHSVLANGDLELRLQPIFQVEKPAGYRPMS